MLRNRSSLISALRNADYPWDDCIADNEPKHGAEAAKRICGSIKAQAGNRRSLISVLQNGDVEGHPFRGNQYSGPNAGIISKVTGSKHEKSNVFGTSVFHDMVHAKPGKAATDAHGFLAGQGFAAQFPKPVGKSSWRVTAKDPHSATTEHFTFHQKPVLGNGDTEGHPFRGNQYTDARYAAIDASDRAERIGKSADFKRRDYASQYQASIAHEEAANEHSRAGKVAKREGDKEAEEEHWKLQGEHSRKSARYMERVPKRLIGEAAAQEQKKKLHQRFAWMGLKNTSRGGELSGNPMIGGYGEGASQNGPTKTKPGYDNEVNPPDDEQEEHEASETPAQEKAEHECEGDACESEEDEVDADKPRFAKNRSMLDVLRNGDFDGHPFRGNQFTDGEDSGGGKGDDEDDDSYWDKPSKFKTPPGRGEHMDKDDQAAEDEDVEELAKEHFGDDVDPTSETGYSSNGKWVSKKGTIEAMRKAHFAGMYGEDERKLDKIAKEHLGHESMASAEADQSGRYSSRGKFDDVRGHAKAIRAAYQAGKDRIGNRSATSLLDVLRNGDVEGHPFRGNQYSGPRSAVGDWVEHPRTGKRGVVSHVYDDNDDKEKGRLVEVDYGARTDAGRESVGEHKENHRESDLKKSGDQKSKWFESGSKSGRQAAVDELNDRQAKAKSFRAEQKRMLAEHHERMKDPEERRKSDELVAKDQAQREQKRLALEERYRKTGQMGNSLRPVNWGLATPVLNRVDWAIANGDTEGHPFRGNQYSQGEGLSKEAIKLSAKADLSKLEGPKYITLHRNASEAHYAAEAHHGVAGNKRASAWHKKQGDRHAEVIAEERVRMAMRQNDKMREDRELAQWQMEQANDRELRKAGARFNDDRMYGPQPMLVVNRATVERDGRVLENFALPKDGWAHIIPRGEFPHGESGLTQVLDEDGIGQIMENFQYDKGARNFGGVRIDFDHFSYDASKPSKAAGWIMDLENREDGLWAKVEWSKSGRESVEGGDYRFVSPVWKLSDCEQLENGRVRPIRLDSVGLTNNPNLRGMVPLSNRAASNGAVRKTKRAEKIRN